MSEDEGVTPFEVALEATPGEVTPRRGKGALGTWRSQGAPGRSAGRVQCPRRWDEPMGKPVTVGAYADQRLNRTAVWEGPWGKAKVRTGLGETDRPGS